MQTHKLTGIGRTTEILFPMTGPEVVVTYHGTEIIQVWKDKIILDSAGWDWNFPCRNKFNQAFSQLRIPLRLSRHGDKRSDVPHGRSRRASDPHSGHTAITRYDGKWNPVAVRKFEDGMEIIIVGRPYGEMKVIEWLTVPTKI